MQPGKPMRPTALRFREAYRKDASGCWLWARKLSGSYGFFTYKGEDGVWRRVQAHKMAWMLAHGPVPVGIWVLHKCDVGACVNPAHLFLGTAKDNTQDMIRKGRAKFRARALSDDDALDAMRRYWSGAATQVALAAEHGLTHRAIGRLVNGGQAYRHLESARKLYAQGTATAAVRGRNL